jgi:ligand-binding sensor domain-containing protein/two-component sensor histidine kinase
MKRIFYFLILFHFVNCSLAQELQPACKHFTTDDELPSSETYRVIQDNKGFIWIATDKGVSRYDGYSFQNFSLKDGLPDNAVLNLFEDEKGRIWFIPISLKLSYYENGKISIYPFNNLINKLTKSAAGVPLTFFADSLMNIKLSVMNYGYIEINKGGTFHQYADTSIESGIKITEPRPNRFFAGFINSAFYKNPLHPSDLHLTLATSNIQGKIILKNFVSTSGIIRLRRLSNNTLMFGISKSVYIINPDLTYKKIELEGQFTSFLEDNDGEIWISSSTGLFRYSHSFTEKIELSSFKGQYVTAITNDNESGYWITTLHDGIYYMKSKDILSLDHKDGLHNEHIVAMQPFQNKLLFADSDGHLQVIQNNTLESFNLPAEKSDEYFCTFYWDSKKDILYRAWAFHTSVYEKGSLKLIPEIIGINQFLPVNNLLYCGSAGQLLIIDKSKCIYNSQAASGTPFRINVFFERRNHEILIGNYNGLWKVTDDLNFKKFNEQNLQLNNRITAIAEDTLGRLFLGTRGKGIMIVDKDTTIFINSSNNLASDNIQQLLFDKNNLFAATNQGLSKITFSNLSRLEYDIKRITVNDGLIGNEVNKMLLLKDDLWIATNKGLSVFKPDKLFADTFQSPVYIQKINIADVDTLVRTDTFNLSPGQNRLRINYTGIIMKRGSKIEYRYRLLGLDTNWNITYAREANFNSLLPGNYEFQLQVRNKSGEWSTKTASVFFFIATPLWKKGWFIVLASALVLITAYSIYRRRLARIEKTQAAKTELNRKIANLELKALRAQMNPHFTFNVMNSIQHFIAHNDTESALRYMAKFAKLIRTILSQSEFSLVKLSDKIQSLQLYVELEQLRFEEKFDVDFIIDESVNTETTRVPTMIIQPYIENAIKHGIMYKEGKGKLLISLERQNGSIIWTVEDNGVGRKESAERNKRKNKQHVSIGMKNTAERIETLNALYGFSLKQEVVDLYDEEGQAIGTRVTVTLPFISN